MRNKRSYKYITIALCTLAVLAEILFGVVIIGIQMNHRSGKKTIVKEAIAECYGEFLAAKSEAVPAAEMSDEQNAFAEWLLENYPKQSAELLEKADNGSLTEKDIYEVVGESIQVLSDRQKGYLKDEETARANQIYLRDGKVEKEAEVTVAGDLCFAEDGFVLDHYDEVNDLEKCISPELLKMMNRTDIFYLNHEYCISEKGAPLEGKYYTFRAKPERMELLKKMGTDIVTLANNHVFDYGADALMDTADYLDAAGLPYVGGGRNQEEAERPIYFVVNGMKIGFVAASKAEKYRMTPAATENTLGVFEAYDTTRFKQVISEVSKECDYLIAYIHWGPEDNNQYADYQVTEGKEFLDSGADIVVGGHPHVLQGIEYMDGKPVIYSMGDFWFNDETKFTGLLKLNITYDGLKEMSFVPCLQTGYTTQYLKEADKQREMYDFLQGLSPNIAIDEKGIITETQ